MARLLPLLRSNHPQAPNCTPPLSPHYENGGMRHGLPLPGAPYLPTNQAAARHQDTVVRRLPFTLPLGATFYTPTAISFCGYHLETSAPPWPPIGGVRSSTTWVHHGHTHHGCPAPGLCLQDTKLSFVNSALVPPLHCLHPKWLLEVKPQTLCSDSSTICEPPSAAQGSRVQAGAVGTLTLQPLPTPVISPCSTLSSIL